MAAALLVLVLGAAPWAPPANAGQVKVAVVVGPVGAATQGYRAIAEAAAVEARRFTSNVVTVYSPDATWPAARAALQGASLVIYLGHGNGFPSPYSGALAPATQDGLGLNPVAGVDDAAHQYFGESALRSEVRLAPHAIVLLNHLCYASGNPEPGMPEATLAEAETRADNYAAGFLAAGAEAVIADAFQGPAWYVRAILSGSGTLDSIWRAAPSFHGHVIGYASRRTPGMNALLDPTDPSSSFYRSIVGRLELRAADVARARAVDGAASGADLPGPVPARGPAIVGVHLSGTPVAGSHARLELAFGAAVPPTERFSVGVRWDPIEIDPVDAAGSAVAGGGPSAPDPASPPPAPVLSRPSAVPGSPSPAATDAADAAAALVTREVRGDVVRIERTTRDSKGLAADVVVPAERGLYRLVATLADADGVAYDAATQDAIPALHVRVTGRLSATIEAPSRIALQLGRASTLDVGVANTGSLAWAQPLPDESSRDGGPLPEADAPMLVAHWVALDGGPLPADPAAVPVRLAPGAAAGASLRFFAPLAPGSYLLVLDVSSPLFGSLDAATGVVTVVHVAVSATPGIPDPRSGAG